MDTDSQLVTAVDILPGNAGDNTGVLELVEQSEENNSWRRLLRPMGMAGRGRPLPMLVANSQGAGSP